MKGKEAIYHYLETHKSFCSVDVAAATGVSQTSVNQAAGALWKAGKLVVIDKVWRTVHYRLANDDEKTGRVSTNQIFNECRKSEAMKRVLAVYGRTPS